MAIQFIRTIQGGLTKLENMLSRPKDIISAPMTYSNELKFRFFKKNFEFKFIANMNNDIKPDETPKIQQPPEFRSDETQLKKEIQH